MRDKRFVAVVYEESENEVEMKTRIGDFKNYGTEETADGVMFTFCVEGEEDCAIAFYNLSDNSVREICLLYTSPSPRD